MKKVFYATLALGALILASCQKENQVNLPKLESPVFTAHIDNGAPALTGTKTVLNGKQSEWNEDHIWVLNGDSKNTSWKKEYKTDAKSGTSASFTEVVNSVLEAGPVVAICPTSAGKDAWWNSTDPKVVNALELTPTQNAVHGSYDPMAHIAVAYSENTTLPFKNAVSLLKFTVGSDNVTEVCIYANTSTDVLSGKFGVAVTGDNVGKIYHGSSGVNNYVKVTGSFKKGETYYLACLPTTFTTGFTIEVVSNGVKGEDKTTNKAFELKRNTILDLGTVEYIEKLVDTRTLYLETGCWNTDNPKYDAWIWGGGVGDKWVDFEQASTDGKYFKVIIPKGITGLKIYRRGQDQTSHDFDNNQWDCSGNITIDDTINCITITGWKNSASTSTKIPTF